MLGYFAWKSAMIFFSFSSRGPVWVCQKVISTGALLLTWSTGLPLPGLKP